MTLQEEVSTSKAKKQTVDPTQNTIERITLTKSGLQIHILETGQKYTYKLEDLYWYDIEDLIRSINSKTGAYIPEPIVGELIEIIYESIEYSVDSRGKMLLLKPV